MKIKILVVLSVLLLALVLTAPALATQPTTGTGFFFPVADPVITDIKTANGNTFITQIVVYNLTGVIEGVYIQEERIKVDANGLAIVQASGNCDPCMVGGQTGTAEIRVIGKKDGTGQFTIVGGTGGLANLHGHGTFNSLTGEFAFSYHFD